MSNNTRKIVVAGDVSIDWLEVSVPAVDPFERDGRMPLNWQLQPGTRMIARPGGALLLARLVALATRKKIITHQLDHLEQIPPEDIIHSMVELDRFPYSCDKKDEKKLVYRVKRFAGFSGPSRGSPGCCRWPVTIPTQASSSLTTRAMASATLMMGRSGPWHCERRENSRSSFSK